MESVTKCAISNGFLPEKSPVSAVNKKPNVRAQNGKMLLGEVYRRESVIKKKARRKTNRRNGWQWARAT